MATAVDISNLAVGNGGGTDHVLLTGNVPFTVSLVADGIENYAYAAGDLTTTHNKYTLEVTVGGSGAPSGVVDGQPTTVEVTPGSGETVTVTADDTDGV